MVKFDLDDAHPDYQRDIPEILAPLVERYPGVMLRSVSLYRPERGDTSMGSTTEDGDIRLNSRWFSLPSSELNQASRHHHVVVVAGVPIGWHSDMPEPRHVLTHEFFHCLRWTFPEVMRWANRAWKLSTRFPRLAPTGYALVNADEFLAECCACYELDKCDFSLRNEVEKFLSRYR